MKYIIGSTFLILTISTLWYFQIPDSEFAFKATIERGFDKLNLTLDLF
jgi:hypothetical protein